MKSIDLKVPPKNKPCHRALRLEVKPPEKRETLLAKFVEPVRRYRVSPVKRGVGLAAGGTF